MSEQETAEEPSDGETETVATSQSVYVLATNDAEGGDPLILDVFEEERRAEQVKESLWNARVPRPHISRPWVYEREVR